MGCQEVVDSVRHEWDQALLCLRACEKLGSAEPAIISIAHLAGRRHQWKHMHELKHRKCQITALEYTALISWLPSEGTHEMCEATLLEDACAGEQLACFAQHTYPPQEMGLSSTTQEPMPLPPCICGQIVGSEQHNHLVLVSSLPKELPVLDISVIPDQQLVDYLCRTRAVFPFPKSDDDIPLVECLLPLRTVFPYRSQLEYIIVRSFTDDEAPLTVMQTALVRDCLKGADRERLDVACGRPCWRVTTNDYYAGHCFNKQEVSKPLSWNLQPGNSSQTEFTGLVQYISQRRRRIAPLPVSTPQPWQADPPLPSRIVIDVSHHHPKSLPAPDGWEVIQRNGRVWISGRNSRVAKLDAAQYHMLLAMCSDQVVPSAPSEQILNRISESCRAQNDADIEFFVHWSRHLVAYLRQITGSELLIGASAVTYNPHFPYFSSPYSPDVHFGAVAEWPQKPALLIIDSFAPPMRRQLLERAIAHGSAVWVLRQHQNPDDPDLAILSTKACLYAELPKKSTVVHKTECWEAAAWDVQPSRYSTQLWRLNIPRQETQTQSNPELLPATVQQLLNCSRNQRYAFHWYEGEIPQHLLLYRHHQQDAIRHGWDGLVAGTDGSVDERSELMGAGYALGDDPVPISTFSARVGGPLATTRAEAASLLQLLLDVRVRDGHQVNLLIFVDCLVLLDILSKWGRSDFYPDPKEVVHFDIIRHLLHELRQWSGNVTLVKIKSHSGCLMNELADEQAELGRMTEHEICPGPQKYGSFWLRVRPAVRELAESSGKPLPRDSAPNRSLLEKMAASNTLRAVKHRSTVFATDLLQRKEGATVSKVIRRCTPTQYRVWLKCMTGTYPVQAYLSRIKIAKSPICPHCSDVVPESLTHFACVCPKFREARTSAHNKVRIVITSFLNSTLGANWKIFEETRMSKTGLKICSTPQATAEQWGRRQPDWVLVSQHHKRIAIVDLCRPSDVHPDQLLAAAMRKQQTYLPLLEALSYYSDQGWTIHVFPWVVGIRGTIDPTHIQSLLKFLGIQRKHWQVAVEKTVLASVRAFYFLHTVRFGGLQDDARPPHDPDHSDDDSVDVMGRVQVKRSLHRTTSRLSLLEDSDSDSPTSPEAMQGSPKRGCPPVDRIVPMVIAAAAPPPSDLNVSSDSPLPLPPRAPDAVRDRRHVGVARKNYFKTPRPARIAVKPKPPVASSRCPYSPISPTRQRPKRRRQDHTAFANDPNPDGVEQRPAKRAQRANPDDSLEVLWTRWRQLEPKRSWRT